MEKKKILDLIKLEVLRCLNDKDKANLQSIKAEGNDFPWKELGDYQNLSSLLPISLELKYPASDLKDKTAMKLYNIREQIKAKIDAKKALEAPEPPVEEISFPAENIQEVETVEQIEVEEKVLVEVEEGVQYSSNESMSNKDDSFKFVSKFKGKSEVENPFRQAVEIETKEPPKAVVDKELVEKIARDYIKTHLERDLETLRSNVNKNKILSFILFVVSLLLIVAMFFIK
jgi:hypothetical protein